MSKGLIVLSSDDIIESGIAGFNEEDLPAIIKGQIEKLNDLDNYIKKANNAANMARDSAENAKDMSAGFGKKKAAIEELQSAGMELAEAVQSGVEAQKIAFECQTNLAKITKYLFGLGVSNIASNRFVVRELEMKLKGASQEELSEIARQELTSVVRQLKEQEDILRKQENILKILKIHDELLQDHEMTVNLQSEQLDTQIQASKRLDERLVVQDEINKQNSEQIKAHAGIFNEHDKQLKIQAEISMRLEEQLNEQVKVDSDQGEQIRVMEAVVKMKGEKLDNQSKKLEKYEEQLLMLKEMNNNLLIKINGNLEIIKNQDIEINRIREDMDNLKFVLNSKSNNIFSKKILVVATIALVMSLIHFFIK